VHRRGYEVGEGGHRCLCLGAALHHRYQAEVAGGCGDRVGAAQHAEYRCADLLQRLAEQVGVALRADPVEHHTGDPGAGWEGAEPVYQRGDRAALCGGVDDEDHRGVEQPGHVGGGAEVARPGAPVVEAHHPFDDG